MSCPKKYEALESYFKRMGIGERFDKEHVARIILSFYCIIGSAFRILSRSTLSLPSFLELIFQILYFVVVVVGRDLL